MPTDYLIFLVEVPEARFRTSCFSPEMMDVRAWDRGDGVDLEPEVVPTRACFFPCLPN